MKYLKLFFYTVPFLVFGFIIFNLEGFCQALPSYELDSSSFNVVQGQFEQYPSFYISPDFAVSLGTDAIKDINDNVSEAFGVDPYWFYSGQTVEEEWATSSQYADAFAKIISNDYSQTYMGLSDAGYKLLSKKIGYLGNYAVAYGLGKINQLTNKITDFCSNIISPVTQTGVDNYLSALNDSISNGNVQYFNVYQPIFTDKLKIALQGNGEYLYVYSNNPMLYYTDNEGYLCVCLPFTYVNTSGTSITNFTSGTHYYNNNSYSIYGVSVGDKNHSFSVDGVNFYYSRLRISTAVPFNGFVSTQYVYGGLNSTSLINYATNLFSKNTDGSIVYNYSSSTLEDIKILLNRLVGKWIDSQSMKSINNIIREIPINNIIINNIDTPVAEIDPSIYQQLDSLIDTVESQQSMYQDIIGQVDSPIPAPDPDPLPSTADYGLTIPDNFPTDTVSPILDTMYLPNSFFSIFEPLFGVFGIHEDFLYNSWLIIPSFLIILALFGLVI